MTTGTRTAVNSYYQSLLTQIKAAGFTSVATTNIENGVIVYYKSKSNPKAQVAIQADKLSKDGVDWTSYDLSLSKTLYRNYTANMNCVKNK